MTCARIFISPYAVRGDFLKGVGGGHATFEPPAHTNYHYQIPASFEQTQRVPTGHPDVCLCDVSGATKEGQVLQNLSLSGKLSSDEVVGAVAAYVTSKYTRLLSGLLFCFRPPAGPLSLFNWRILIDVCFNTII